MLHTQARSYEVVPYSLDYKTFRSKVGQRIWEIIADSIYTFHELINENEQPSHFLALYEARKLLWYIQYGYYTFAWERPFYYIESLQNITEGTRLHHSKGKQNIYKKGVWKKLMLEFLRNHTRVFLDDAAHIHGNDARWYYAQFGMAQLEGTNVWYNGFTSQEAQATIPYLLTQVVISHVSDEVKHFL